MHQRRSFFLNHRNKVYDVATLRTASQAAASSPSIKPKRPKQKKPLTIRRQTKGTSLRKNDKPTPPSRDVENAQNSFPHRISNGRSIRAFSRNYFRPELEILPLKSRSAVNTSSTGDSDELVPRPLSEDSDEEFVPGSIQSSPTNDREPSPPPAFPLHAPSHAPSQHQLAAPSVSSDPPAVPLPSLSACHRSTPTTTTTTTAATAAQPPSQPTPTDSFTQCLNNTKFVEDLCGAVAAAEQQRQHRMQAVTTHADVIPDDDLLMVDLEMLQRTAAAPARPPGPVSAADDRVPPAAVAYFPECDALVDFWEDCFAQDMDIYIPRQQPPPPPLPAPAEPPQVPPPPDEPGAAVSLNRIDAADAVRLNTQPVPVPERPVLADVSVAGSSSGSSEGHSVNGAAAQRSSVPSEPHTPSKPATTAESPRKSDSPSRKAQLRYWGVPESVCGIYSDAGISTLYPWQVECLEQPGVLSGGNLVYSAPTSGGKTLVAEVLMVRMLQLLRGKRVLFILPFVSVVAEKVEYLKRVFKPLDILVEGFYANRGGGGLERDETAIDVAVCTIEKANSLVNRLLEDNKIRDIGMVVIDEIHMIGDVDRGYLLELLITKLKYAHDAAVAAAAGGGGGDHPLQVIGLSATLPNIHTFRDWLDAAIYVTDFRPIPLAEYVKIGSEIFDRSFSNPRKITTGVQRSDPDQLVPLCTELTSEGHSVLVFCATKRDCEKTCDQVAALLEAPTQTANAGSRDLLDERNMLIAHLRRTPAGIDPILEQTILKGVAFHHAGLTVEERELVEEAFRSGTINILMATSTLAAGVNLPARRVIFRTPYVGMQFIDVTRYRQMAGRAGRKGKDTQGESILIASKKEVEAVKELLNKSLPSLESCLAESKRGMVRPLMEAISSGVVETPLDIERYVRCTLFAAQRPWEEVKQATLAALAFLSEHELIEWDPKLQKYCPTKLGKAITASSLSPEEGLIVFEELARARQQFALDHELHLVYQVTPVYHGITPNWQRYLQLFSTMSRSAAFLRVAEFVGVYESFLVKCTTANPMVAGTAEHEKHLRVHKRFYAALILCDLVNEMPLWRVSQKYGIPRGTLQSLQMSAATFSGMVTAFCQRLRWWELEVLLANFTDRFSFGVQTDILALVQIPHVKGFRARVLYAAGYKTVAAVAAATPEEIEQHLRNATPFKSKQAVENPEYMRRIEARTARLIVMGARKLLLSQSENLMMSAKALSANLHQPLTSPDVADNDRSFNASASFRRHTPNVARLLSTKQPSPARASRSRGSRSKKDKDATNRRARHGSGAANDSPSQPSDARPPRMPLAALPLPPPLPRTPTWPSANELATVPSSLQHLSPIPAFAEDAAVAAAEAQLETSSLLAALAAAEADYAARSAVAMEITDNQPTIAPLAVVGDSVKAPEFTEPAAPPPPLPPTEASKPAVAVKAEPMEIDMALEEALAAAEAALAKSHKRKLGEIEPLADVAAPLDMPIKRPKLLLLESPCKDDPFQVVLPVEVAMATTKTAPEDLKSTSIAAANATKAVPTKQLPITALFKPAAVTTAPVATPAEHVLPPPMPALPATSSDAAAMVPVSAEMANRRGPAGPPRLLIVGEAQRLNVISRQEFETLWRARSTFAWALHTRTVFLTSGAREVGDGDTRVNYAALDQLTAHTAIDAIAVCWDSKTVYYMSLGGDVLDRPERWGLMVAMLTNHQAFRIAFDMLTQLKALLANGIRVAPRGPLADPRIACWMLNPEDLSEVPLESLVGRHLGAGEAKKLSKLGSGHGQREAVCRAVLGSWGLMVHLSDMLKVERLYGAFLEVEMPLVPVLAEMEHWGIGFVPAVCKRHSAAVVEKMSELEKRAHVLAGRQFSLTAPGEIGTVLFDELGLPQGRIPSRAAAAKANKKHPQRGTRHCTSKEVLRGLAEAGHELPKVILAHRKLAALMSKYIDVLPKYARTLPALNMSRICATWLQTHTPTGRLAIKNPNLQAIPHSHSFLPSVSSAAAPVSICIRDAFVAADGCVLLAADYSQLEVRLMAHFCAHRAMRVAVLQPNGHVCHIPFAALADAGQSVDAVGYDFTENRMVARPVVRWWRNGRPYADNAPSHGDSDWLIVHHEGAPNEPLVITANHEVFTPEGTKRPIGRLRNGDWLLYFTPLLEGPPLEAFLGMAMAHRHGFDTHPPLTAFRWTATRAPVEYQNWKANLLRPWMAAKRTAGEYWLASSHHIRRWYERTVAMATDTPGAGEVPQAATPLTLAVWFLEAGRVVVDTHGQHTLELASDWTIGDTALAGFRERFPTLPFVRKCSAHGTAGGLLLCGEPAIARFTELTAGVHGLGSDGAIRDALLAAVLRCRHDASAVRMFSPVRITAVTNAIVAAPQLRSRWFADDTHEDRFDLSIAAANHNYVAEGILVSNSHDPLLVDTLRKGGDVFKQIASQWLDKPVESITAEQRTRAKHIVYGILYGIGATSLAESLGVTSTEAAEFMESFKQKYQGMAKFLEKTIALCKEHGYVETVRGRRRYLPAIRGQDVSKRAQAERQAVNTICQGSAADLVKIAMINIVRRFPPRDEVVSTRLLLQIHDELLFEVPEQEVEQIATSIKYEMEHALPQLIVPMVVNLSVGKSWGSLNPYVSGQQ